MCTKYWLPASGRLVSWIDDHPITAIVVDHGCKALDYLSKETIFFRSEAADGDLLHQNLQPVATSMQYSAQCQRDQSWP